MEVSSNLLVAMMFITILSIGIGNILMALPPIIDRRTDLTLGRLHVGWILLLLLMHLNLFWQVLVILTITDWSFADFLFITLGPVLLLLATSILLPDPGSTEDPRKQYLSAAPLVFPMLALLLLWLPSLDWVFGEGLHASGIANVAVAGVFALLAVSSSSRIHSAGLVFSWLAFGVMTAARGLSLIP